MPNYSLSNSSTKANYVASYRFFYILKHNVIYQMFTLQIFAPTTIPVNFDKKILL